MLRSLKLQMYAIAFVPLLVTAIVGTLANIQALDKLAHSVGGDVESAVIDIEKKRLVSVMGAAQSIIQPYIDMPGKEGLDPALEVLSRFEYDDGTGYLFGSYTDGIRALFGTSGQGVGQNFLDLQDKKGNYLIRDIIGVAKKGGGYYTYYFNKPGQTEASPKYSYIIYIKKWDLILGTGFYIDSVDPVLSSIDQAIEKSQQKSLFSNIMTTLLIAAIIGVIVTIFTRGIYKSLDRLSESVSALANGEGDLTKQITSSNIDTLRNIADNFNRFLKSMAIDVGEINHTGHTLTDMAEQATSRQKSLALSSDEQKQQTLHIAAAMDEMASTSSEMAERAKHTQSSAEAAEAQVKDVLNQAQLSQQELESLDALLNSVETSLRELGDNVDNINSVLDVIQGISEQTNLLALNAAIEAARAGEQGRGFAVVADEVRGLAKRSQDSTIEIAHILEKLKASAEKTHVDMGTSSKKRETVIEAIGKIRNLIDSASASIQELTSLNVQVASAATEQSMVVGDVAKTVNGIAHLADKMGQETHETHKQFEALNELALRLNNISDKYRV